MKRIDDDLLPFLLLAGLVLAFSLYRPYIPWDTLAYHLPFGVKLTGTAGADAFHLSSVYYGDDLVHRFQGFPLLPYYLHGALFRLFGSLNALVLVSAVPFLLFILYAHRLFQVSRILTTLCCLAVPLVSIHVHSSYIDLLTGVCTASVILTTIKFCFFPHRGRETIVLAVLVALFSILCGQIKFFSLPFVYICLFACLVHVFRQDGSNKGAATAILLGAVVLAASKLILNQLHFANPFYPVAVFGFPGPETAYSTNPGYFAWAGPLARPLYFLTSLFEVDYLIRGVAPAYDLSSAAGDKPLRFNPARMGGFGFLGVGAFCAVQALVVRQTWSRFKGPLLFILLLIGVNAFLPQSYELRYWLYLPFVAAFLLALQIKEASPATLYTLCLLFATVAAANQVFIGRHEALFSLHPLRPTSVDATRIAAERPDYLCTGKDVWFPFLFSTVLHKGEWITNHPGCKDRARSLRNVVFVHDMAGTFTRTIKHEARNGTDHPHAVLK